MPSWTRHITCAAVLAVASLLAGSGSALAATSPCGTQYYTQPFAAWGDTGSYFLAPNGDLSAGASGWKLTGGAQVISTPFSPVGVALYIPNGGSATTPPFCVSSSSPTARAFGLTLVPPVGTGVGMQFDLVYGNGNTKSVGQSPTIGAWSPTRKISLASGSLPLVNGAAMVSYRFTAINGASSLLNDVWVDPRMR